MKSILTSLLLLFVNLVFAQSNFQVDGSVKSDKNSPVDLALVAILSESDSTIIKSVYTDRDGSFSLTKIPPGNYIVQVSMLGFSNQSQNVEISKNTVLEAIIIQEASTQIDEVTIKGKVPYIERQIDRTVVNVDALISNAGSNALEVLEKAPGITIDNNGAIILKGRSGVTVFINDKPTYLSGAELENYLRSLPAGTLQKIEIMTNPPAKYEAAGNAGVINIVTKRNRLQGFYGNISTSLRQGRYTSSNNAINLNYNKNKLGLSANISTGFYNSFQDLFINRYYKDADNALLSSFSQNSLNLRKGRYLNGKLSLEYYLTDKTTLGVSYKNQTSPGQRTTLNNATVADPNQEIMQRVVADNVSNNTFRSAVYNASINHNIDSSGSTISFDADLVKYKSGSDQNFKNFLYNTQNQLDFQDEIEGLIPSEISIYAAKTDYTKPLGENAKFEAGAKSARTETDNEAIYKNTIDGVTTPDYNLSNRFIYDEWINAAYVNYSRSLGPVSLQGGLRLESTNFTGEQLGNVEKPDTSFTRSYTQLFPTFYAQWQMDSTYTNSLTFSYGRRIDRPYFQDLNPFISPLDKFTFYSGNPNLLPTFSHNFSLSYSYKSLFSTTLNYSKTLDGINETLEIRDGIYYSRPGNIATNETFSLSFESTIPVTKWYTINAYAEASHLTFESQLYTEQLNSSGTFYYLSATNTFQLGKGWSADVSGLYRSDLVYAQLLLKSYGQLSFGVQKKILDGKGNLKFALNDALYTRRGDGIINNLFQTEADWNSTYDSRVASLTFSWRFGKSTSNKQRRNSSGSDSEQRRVRN